MPVDLPSPTITSHKLAESEGKVEYDVLIATNGKLGLEIGHLADRLLVHF